MQLRKWIKDLIEEKMKKKCEWEVSIPSMQSLELIPQHKQSVCCSRVVECTNIKNVHTFVDEYIHKAYAEKYANV